MASVLSSTRKVPPRLAPVLEAAAVGADAPPYRGRAGDVAATGDATGPHRQHLRPAAGPLQILDPALTLVAIDVPLAVAAKAATDTAAGDTAAPHRVATGHAPAHTAAHLLQTGPQDTETTGHAPDPPATATETGRQ